MHSYLSHCREKSLRVKEARHPKYLRTLINVTLTNQKCLTIFGIGPQAQYWHDFM